tara:strand:- start:175 stop:999 length:825 start_codon:yes stop_codon:yes gene_type:complete
MVSNYGQIGTDENVPCRQGSDQTSEPYDIETGSKEGKRPSNRRHCIYNLCVIFIIIVGYSIYIYLPTMYVEYYTPSSDFNFTEDIIDSPPSSDLLTAGVLVGHSHYHRFTCDDTQYGCCEVYKDCQIKTGYIDYDDIKLSVYRIEAEDRIQSNCPSLDHLVHMWNQHYKSGDCTNSTYGCCPPVNTACDFAFRNERGNNQDTIDFYKQHRQHSHRITVPKQDKQGSNCPGHRFPDPIIEIIIAFDNNYPDPNSDLHFLLGLGVFFIVFIARSQP